MVNEQAKDNLPDAQLIFCHEYIKDWNGSRAYKIAYPKCKSDGAARANASRLLTKDNVKAYIKAIQLDLAKEANISVLLVILELKKIIFSNISDIFKDDYSIKDLTDLNEAALASLDGVTLIKRKDKAGNDFVIVRTKRADKLKAIELLAKLMGWLKEKEGGAVEVNIPFTSWALSPKEKEADIINKYLPGPASEQ